jgi:hypothetical protein
MFSKTYTSNLFLINNHFNSKYKLLTSLYVNSNDYLNSHNYGTKKQQNFLTQNSLLPNQKTFFDSKSFFKLINVNLNVNEKNFNSLKLFKNFNYFTKNTNNIKNFPFSLSINNFFTKKNYNTNNSFFTNFVFYNDYLNKINDNTENKKILLPINKLFNKKFKKNKNFYFFENNPMNSFNDLNFFKNTNEDLLFLNNSDKFFKTFSLFSSNQTISLNDKTIRNFVNISPNFSSLNYSENLNQISNYLNFKKTYLESNNLFFYNLSNLN